MTPRKDCQTCGGDGIIVIPCGYENCHSPLDCPYCDTIDCPECEVIDELENEQVNK